jgi:hypothetical protein
VSVAVNETIEPSSIFWSSAIAATTKFSIWFGVDVVFLIPTTSPTLK